MTAKPRNGSGDRQFSSVAAAAVQALSVTGTVLGNQKNFTVMYCHVIVYSVRRSFLGQKTHCGLIGNLTGVTVTDRVCCSAVMSSHVEQTVRDNTETRLFSRERNFMVRDDARGSNINPEVGLIWGRHSPL